MPKPVLDLEVVLEVVTEEAQLQLLEKINITKRTIELRIKYLVSDLEILHCLNVLYLLGNFLKVFASHKTVDQKKERLRLLLAERWEDIKGTNYSYCEQPRDLLNQLCLAIAFYISPLPEDLSECDDWRVGQGPYFLLMPSLEACSDIVLGGNIHQYQLQEFILSEDNKRYIPVFEVLNFYFSSTALKPVHMVFSEEQMADVNLDKKDDSLTEPEIYQLSNHSILTDKIMKNLAILKDPNFSFFNRLSELADGLMAGSSHNGGAGNGDNAAAQANEAIVTFFEYWDSLVEGSRNYYLQKVPKLGAIFKRLRDPVSIANQGLSYCIGITGGELRFAAREHRENLQSYDSTKLQVAVQKILTQLETDIKRAKYSLNPVQKNAKPLVYRIMNIQPNEQAHLIKIYLHMEYPNFLFYALDQQPALVPLFIKALPNSKYKQHILQQNTNEGMTVLMMAAQSYPEALETLLLSYLGLDNTLIKDELIIIVQRHPEALPQLLAAVTKFQKNEQLNFLTGRDGNDTSLIMSAMETNAAAFIQICDVIKMFPVDDIEKILEHTNHNGNNLLMSAFLEYPHAVGPLLTLFDMCGENTKKNWIGYCNNTGFNLVFLALHTEAKFFKTILDVAADMPLMQHKSILTVGKESFFLRASYSSAENFNASLRLLDNFPLEEQKGFIQDCDIQNNHLLLLTMLHQPIPPAYLFNKLKILSTAELFSVLNTKNHKGFFPLTLALTQQPQYFISIVDIISRLSPDQQNILWQQVDANGYFLPFLAALYAPEHTPCVLNHVIESTLFAVLKQTDFNGIGFLELIASFQPELLTSLIIKINMMPVEQRFLLLCHCNQQGNNLLSWMLLYDTSLLGHLFELMKGFTIAQQLALVTQRNHQNQYALTIAYIQDIALLDHVLQSVDEFNVGKKEIILTQLPLAHWFDLLSLVCANSSVFQRFYASYQRINKKDERALGDLLSYSDSHNNNLMMLILQNNPSFVGSLIRDIKAISDEKTQRQIMLQTNSQKENVLSLAEKYTSDHFVALLQSLLKRLDKQGTKQMMLVRTIKMHTGDMLISSEIKESCNLEVKTPDDRDERDNKLFSAITKGEVDVCQRLIRTTRTVSIDNVVEIMLRNKHALMSALTGTNKSMKGLICKWLLTVPQIARFKILSNFSADVILSLLDDEKMSLIDALPLHHQTQLFSLRDDIGQNVLVKAFTNNHPCREKLINRLRLFTPLQQATLFQANAGNLSFIHALAKNPLYFKEAITELSRLSCDTQFVLLRQVDYQKFTVLEHLRTIPDLYVQVLHLYDNLGLKKQIQLYMQPTGPQNVCILINSPIQFRSRIVEQFLKFPQKAKIEILLDMINKERDSLKIMLETVPHLQLQLLDMIQSLPKPILGILVSPKNEFEESLISWMFKSPYTNLTSSALTLMSKLAKTDLSVLLKHKNRNGDNLLQDIAKNLPLLFKPVFSIFLSLRSESKMELLLEPNTNGRNLFSDLVALKCYDHFENLCETIAQFPSDKKIKILSASGIVPITTTTRWVSLLYGAPQCKAFINLLNNKSFFSPMFHLLQSLPPETQIMILTNRSCLGKTVLDEINEPEQTELRLILKNAQAFFKARKLLNKMSTKISNDQVFGLESLLHQKLVNRLESYQNTYHKSMQHIYDLAEGWINDIETDLPQIGRKLTSTNIFTTCLKFAGSVIMPPYGGYNLYKKATTSRHIFFRSDQEKILYDIEDLGLEFKQTANAYPAKESSW